MGQTKAPVAFGDWLRRELDARNWGIRTLARHMNPANPEAARRMLNRYVHEGMRPTDANRAEIGRGLGIEADEVPTGDDDEEDRQRMTLDGFLRSEIRRVLAEERGRVAG